MRAGEGGEGKFKKGLGEGEEQEGREKHKQLMK